MRPSDTVGVDVIKNFELENALSLCSARSSASASVLVASANLSTSSAISIRTGLEAKLAGEFEPTKLSVERVNCCSKLVILSLSIGQFCAIASQSSSIGSHLLLEKERARFSVGISHNAGLGSLSISHARPAISVVVFEVWEPQHNTNSEHDESFHASKGSRV